MSDTARSSVKAENIDPVRQPSPLVSVGVKSHWVNFGENEQSGHLSQTALKLRCSPTHALLSVQQLLTSYVTDSEFLIESWRYLRLCTHHFFFCNKYRSPGECMKTKHKPGEMGISVATNTCCACKRPRFISQQP